MNIDLSKIDIEVLIECIKEENERDNFIRNTLERQIKDHQTYGKQEEFEQTYNRYLHKKDYFNCLINTIHNVDIIEEINNEFIQFFKDLIDHQIYISNERIKDWSVGGDMYHPEICKDIEIFENACNKIINMESSKILCMKKIDSIINK